MPRGNGMGPMSMGAMSGRGAGYCAGTGMPGFANRIPGRGSGMGFGRGSGSGGGRGWRHMFNATGLPGRPRFGVPYQQPDPEMEKQVLKRQADTLQSELDLIKKRLSEMETSA